MWNETNSNEKILHRKRVIKQLTDKIENETKSNINIERCFYFLMFRFRCVFLSSFFVIVFSCVNCWNASHCFDVGWRWLICIFVRAWVHAKQLWAGFLKSLYVMLCICVCYLSWCCQNATIQNEHNVLPIHTDVNVTLFRSSTCSLNKQPIEIEEWLREYYELRAEQIGQYIFCWVSKIWTIGQCWNSYWALKRKWFHWGKKKKQRNRVISVTLLALFLSNDQRTLSIWHNSPKNTFRNMGRRKAKRNSIEL